MLLHKASLFSIWHSSDRMMAGVSLPHLYMIWCHRRGQANVEHLEFSTIYM